MNSSPQNIQLRTFEFACQIVELYEVLLKRRGSARSLARQLFRAGTSIGANLEEATAGQSKADFVSKCCIASKEARETYYWLRLLKRTQGLETSQLDPLIREANEIISILTVIVKRASPGVSDLSSH